MEGIEMRSEPLAEKFLIKLVMRENADDADEFDCNVDFGDGVTFGQAIVILRNAIVALGKAASKLGRAKGLSEKEISALLFGEGGDNGSD